MEKTAQKYLEADPWAIVEKGFHKDKTLVSESLFSQANEYGGVRGYFEEGGSFPSLRGSYFNGIYDYAKEDTPNAYLGIIKRTHFMVNAMDYFKISLQIDDEKLDLARAKISDFERRLDFRTGELTRSFVWHLKNGNVSLSFARFLSMNDCHRAYQRIKITADASLEGKICFCLDGNMIQWGHDCFFTNIHKEHHDNEAATISQTLTTNQKVASFMKIATSMEGKYLDLPMGVEVGYELALPKGQPVVFTRYITGRAIYWAEEVGTFGLVWITMIGAGICVKKRGHFTMPTFIDRFPPRVRYVIDLLNHGLIMVFGVLLLVTGVDITRESWTMLSPALEVNLAIINSAAIVCGALIIIYGIGQVMGIIRAGSAASPGGHS